MSEPKKVWWCEEHGDMGSDRRCLWESEDSECRMVRMLLVPEGSAVDRLSQFLMAEEEE